MHYAGLKVAATGYMIPGQNDFVVLKGSEMSKTETNSCDAGTKKSRQELIDTGVVVDRLCFRILCPI